MAHRAVAAASTSTRKNLLIWLVAFGVFALAVVFASGGYSSAWCSACHAMRVFADAQQTTSHRGVSCVRCHAPGSAAYAQLRGREAAAMWPAFLLSFGSATLSGPSAELPDPGCLGCHRAIETGTVQRDGLRIRHATCVAPGQACTDCHDAVAHGKATRAARALSMEACTRCHDGTKTSARCDLCHSSKLPKQRIARGPWAVTHGPNWQKTHGLGGLSSCRVCHATDFCTRCHGIPLPHPEGFPALHGKVALQQRAQCLRCHADETFCTTCHGMQMPHPAGFLPGHTKVAKGFDDIRCARCHLRSTCDDCHVKHTHPGRTSGTIGVLPRTGVR